MQNKDIYYRVFKTYFGIMKKTRVKYLRDDGKIRFQGENHKIKGSIDEAINIFKNHCHLSRFEDCQYCLVELGTDSQYHVIAIQKVNGVVVELV